MYASQALYINNTSSAMHKNQLPITINYFINLYKNKQSNLTTRPILQILGFEASQHLSSSDILVRLSDEITFVDCTLNGPFTLQNNKIIQFSTEEGLIQYKKYSLIKVLDFSTKVEQNRISRMKIIIRNLQLVSQPQMRYGLPAQLHQYLDNEENGPEQENVSINQQFKEEPKDQHINQPVNMIKIEGDPNENKRVEVKQNVNSKGFIIRTIISESSGPLANSEILAGKEGYFMGRLLRIKLTIKQTKEGSMSVLILGFLDCNNELIRINMAGRTAIKQHKELKKKRIYYIRGLETYQTEKMPQPQIKIREKEFKISEVQNQKINELFDKSYHHWDHQLCSIQSQRVDVVGVIEDIQDKITNNTNFAPGQARQAIRLVIKNIFKTVKVSFWAEQMNTFKNSKLKKRDAIILEDIKKKKSLFLDFTHESSIIKLEDEPDTKAEVQQWLPAPQQPRLPTNIGQLSSYFEEEEQKSKIVRLVVFLIKIQVCRMIYKLCADCKKKVDNEKQNCPFCKCVYFEYKFNCQFEFADSIGSVSCIAFDGPANEILKKSAKEISVLSQQELNVLEQDLLYKEYEIGIENKNLRFIIRNVEEVGPENQVRMSQKNAQLIKELLPKLQ